MTFTAYQQAVEALRRSRFPLIVLLQDVDADALGSSMAIVRSLQQQRASPMLFCLAPIPENLQFLLDPAVPVRSTVADVPLDTIDAIVVGDTGHLARTGIADELQKLVARSVPLINIDHHEVATAFGTINVIDPDASATTVLVYDLLKLGGWTIDRHIATALLAGIVADTDNFSNAGTTIRALEVAAHCYAKGAESRRIIRALYRSKPVDALKLWGAILARLTKNQAFGIVSTVILQDDFRSYAISDESTEGLANFLNGIGDMRAALILKELPGGYIRGSLRTTRDDVNVGKLAERLGGGGHRKAAGFTVRGKLIRHGAGWRVE